jgi:hypothetical protein
MTRRSLTLVRLGSGLALALVIAGCTKGGQFDPTEIFSSDMFDSKKKIQGTREPVFPNGVPGTTQGIPPDLVKGYQPPPEPTESAEQAPPEEKPKPKPRPKVASAPAQPKPPRSQITIGRSSSPNADGAQPPPQSGGSPWPAAPQQSQAASQQAAGQSPWPAPQQASPGPWPANPAPQ